MMIETDQEEEKNHWFMSYP